MKSKQKIFRYLICGIITAIFNVVLIYIIIETLKLNAPILRNIANIVAIEISLLFSFFVYRTWVWTQSKSNFKEMIYRQIPLFHISCAAALVARGLIVFPILDFLKFNYIINNLIGIIIGSVINYKFSDKWVFKTRSKQVNG